MLKVRMLMSRLGKRKFLTRIQTRQLDDCSLRTSFPFPLNLLSLVVNESLGGTHVILCLPVYLFLMCIIGAMFSNVSLFILCYPTKWYVVILSSVNWDSLLLNFGFCGPAALEGDWQLTRTSRNRPILAESPGGSHLIHFERKVSRKTFWRHLLSCVKCIRLASNWCQASPPLCNLTELKILLWLTKHPCQHSL